MRRFVYMIAWVLAKLILFCVAKKRVLGAAHTARPGGWVLAPNHISHFDPVTLSAIVGRNVDWMAMAGLFRNRTAATCLRLLNAFPTDRAQVDRASVRTALGRLKSGRVVGIFPEGGIRAGMDSVIAGAPIKPGVATMAEMAGVPVIPCVLFGTDRLYRTVNWLPFRRIRIWAVFGEPIHPPGGLPRHEAREKMAAQLSVSFRELYATARREFALSGDDLPQPRGRGNGRA